MGKKALNNVKAAFSLFFDLGSDLFFHSVCRQMKELSLQCFILCHHREGTFCFSQFSSYEWCNKYMGV